MATAFPLRISTRPLRLAGIALLLMSCDFDMDGKHSCKENKDCIGERSCFEGTCIKRCDVLTDCSGSEFCSLLTLNDRFATACVSEDQCWDEDDCPVGEHGSVCSRNFFPSLPAGCIEWGCTTADNCPESWKCLVDDMSVDDMFFSALGACSNGEAGHPCIDDEDCNAPLVCDDIFEQVCVEEGM